MPNHLLFSSKLLGNNYTMIKWTKHISGKVKLFAVSTKGSEKYEVELMRRMIKVK